MYYLPEPVVGKIPKRHFIRVRQDFGLRATPDLSVVDEIAPVQLDFDIYFGELRKLRQHLDQFEAIQSSFDIPVSTLHIMWGAAMRAGRLLQAQHSFHGTIFSAAHVDTKNPTLWVPPVKSDAEGDFHSQRWGRLYLTYDPYQAA